MTKRSRRQSFYARQRRRRDPVERWLQSATRAVAVKMGRDPDNPGFKFTVSQAWLYKVRLPSGVISTPCV